MLDKQFNDNIGLKYALADNVNGISLVIILAGTNDLGKLFRGGFDDTNINIEKESDSISESVISLHQIAHKNGVPTIALAIPGSRFQTGNQAATAIAFATNEKLENWCRNNSNNCLFMAFPFPYQKGDDHRWMSDGLHLTEAGYKELAKDVANMINVAYICFEDGFE